MDHSSVYEPPGKPTTAKCGGPIPRAADNKAHKSCIESKQPGKGECYFVDSTHSNNWRALRILNETHDLTYVEYTARDFDFGGWSQPF